MTTDMFDIEAEIDGLEAIAEAAERVYCDAIVHGTGRQLAPGVLELGAHLAVRWIRQGRIGQPRHEEAPAGPRVEAVPQIAAPVSAATEEAIRDVKPLPTPKHHPKLPEMARVAIEQTKKPEGAIKLLVCSECGKGFEPRPYSKNQQCGQPCAVKAAWRKKRAAQASAQELTEAPNVSDDAKPAKPVKKSDWRQVPCAFCGKQIWRRAGGEDGPDTCTECQTKERKAQQAPIPESPLVEDRAAQESGSGFAPSNETVNQEPAVDEAPFGDDRTPEEKAGARLCAKGVHQWEVTAMRGGMSHHKCLRPGCGEEKYLPSSGYGNRWQHKDKKGRA